MGLKIALQQWAGRDVWHILLWFHAVGGDDTAAGSREGGHPSHDMGRSLERHYVPRRCDGTRRIGWLASVNDGTERNYASAPGRFRSTRAWCRYLSARQGYRYTW